MRLMAMNRIAVMLSFLTCLIFSAIPVSAASGRVEVEAFAENGAPPQPVENIALRLYNRSNASLNLSSWRIRYWLCDSESLESIKYSVWWYSLGSNGAVTMSFGGDSAQRYVDISFDSGKVDTGAYAEVQFGLNNSNWKNISNSLAYSASSTTGYAVNSNVAVYHLDTLIYGTPYAGGSGSSGSSGSSTGGTGTSTGTSSSGSSSNGTGNVVFENELENAQHYAVWGVKNVRLSDRTHVYGKVGAGDNIDIGAQAQILGDAVSANHISLRSYSNVRGTVRAPTIPQIQDGATVTGGMV